jgi:hypothetical protein
MRVVGAPDIIKCIHCGHDCHCDIVVCDTQLSIVKFIRVEPCGCGVCECKPKRPDWG